MPGRYAQHVRDDLLYRRIRLALLGRRGYAHLERIAEPAGDTVARCARHYFNRQFHRATLRYAAGVARGMKHATASPASVQPIR